MKRWTRMAAVVAVAVGVGGAAAVAISAVEASRPAAGTDSTPPKLGDGNVEDAVVRKPLTVEEARGVPGNQPITVCGFLLVKDGEARLSDVSLDSYPPQVPKSPWSLVVRGVDLDALDLERAGGVAWSHGITLTGTMVGGILNVTRTDARTQCRDRNP